MTSSGLQGTPYLRTFLALRDRDTNEIRLVEANTATLGAVVTPPEATNPLILKRKSSTANKEEEGRVEWRPRGRSLR